MIRKLIATAAVLGLLLPGAPAIRAATMPTISEFTMSTHEVSVTGLHVAEVVIEARIVAPDGQGHGTGDFPPTFLPGVWMHKSGGFRYLPNSDHRAMELVSGSDTDGVWRATVRVPSTYDGEWSATVCAQAPMEGGEEGSITCLDPSSVGGDDSLTVVGRDQPRVKVLTLPTRLPGGRIVGEVVVSAFLRDSGRPIRNRLLLVCTYGCWEGDPPLGQRVTTDARGIARFILDSRETAANQLWFLAAARGVRMTDNVLYLITSIAPPLQLRLSARVEPTSIRLGAGAMISGGSASATSRATGGWRSRSG